MYKETRERIKQDYIIYDALLEGLDPESNLFIVLHSCRNVYSFGYNHTKSKNGKNFRVYLFKALVKTFVKFILLPFFGYKIVIKNETVIIAYTRADITVAELLGYKIFQIGRRKYGLRHQLLSKWILFFKCFIYLTKYKIGVKRFIFMASALLDVIGIGEHEINLDSCCTIISENDVDPIYAFIIQKAKLKGIKTIKFETSFIDAFNHNEVLCEFYYCPNLMIKKIRDNFKVNEKLEYNLGGYVSLDILNTRHPDNEILSSNIVYFTQPLIPGFDQKFIDDILELMPSGWTLKLKLHPNDDQCIYVKYKELPDVTVLQGRNIDNYELILSSRYNFSVMSFLTFEAKHLNENSFYINYHTESYEEYFSYSSFDGFIDTIRSRKQLKSLFSGDFIPSSREHFIAEMNPRFPATVTHFKKWIEEINKK